MKVGKHFCHMKIHTRYCKNPLFLLVCVSTVDCLSDANMYFMSLVNWPNCMVFPVLVCKYYIIPNLKIETLSISIMLVLLDKFFFTKQLVCAKMSFWTQDILVGLLRLRKCGRNTTCPELMGKCSIVRELHVYGTAVPVHGRDADKLQHQVKIKSLVLKCNLERTGSNRSFPILRWIHIKFDTLNLFIF